MSARYVGFDIETAKVLAEGAKLQDERPLGITCAAFNGADVDTVIAAEGARMTPAEVERVASTLDTLADQGYTIITWNGLAFDFDILAEEAEPHVAKRIAQFAVSDHHVDLMFHFVCAKGFRCGLAKACEGMGIQGKTEGMSGAQAPQLWAAGERQKVLEYVMQDARIQRLLAEGVDKEGRLFWVTQKGKLSHAVLGKPRSVSAALMLPEPDTSWMTDPNNPPPQRKWFTWWAKRYGVVPNEVY